MNKALITGVSILLFFLISLLFVWWRLDSTMEHITEPSEFVDSVQIEEHISRMEEEERELRKGEDNRNLEKTISTEQFEMIQLLIENREEFTDEQFLKSLDIISRIEAGAKVQEQKFLPEIKQVATPAVAPSAAEILEKETSPVFSFVLVGKDTRKKGGSLNTDVIMVVLADPKQKSITLLSLPRDLKVEIPGYAEKAKINSAYAKGEIARAKIKGKNEGADVSGPTLLKQTIEKLLGIPIQYYVAVDFEGFVQGIDALGGITVNVDKEMKYHDPTDGTSINLQPGVQVLDGKNALGFVRHRMDDRGSAYYSSDFTRNERQQLVMKEVIRKVQTEANVLQLLSLVDILGDHLKTDIPKEKMKTILFQFVGFHPDNVLILPSNGYWDRSTLSSKIPDDYLQMLKELLQKQMGTVLQ